MRDFKWDDEGLENQKKEIARLEQEEKELWVSAVLNAAAALTPRPSCFASPG